MGNEIQIKKETKSAVKKYLKKIHSSKDAIVIVTQENGYIEANKKAVKFFEAKSREELLKHRPDTLSPKMQSHLGKSSKEVLKEVIEKAWKSKDGYYDLIVEHISLKGNQIFARVWVSPVKLMEKIAVQAVIKKVSNPILDDQKSNETTSTDIDSSLIKPKIDDDDDDDNNNNNDDDESSDSYIETQTETRSILQKQTSISEWTKDNLDKEILKLDEEIEKGRKEKGKLEKIKFKVLQKQVNERTQENTQLKNEILVLQQLLDEMKRSNEEIETESQLQEKIQICKKKKKKYKTEVERLTNRLKMVEFEKENLKKLM
ncbi:hypothetical protein M0811_10733 [Anaeramoeba ignava]|uniref:PAS domain-containing protein n=1 Tax=Anaeramoeba ignava TaxID=1746090 RepID=A0A9Q0R8Q9_ANAIG|nr:hypothetical protein M0811_10733 [Anaeramoeba ignava]